MSEIIRQQVTDNLDQLLLMLPPHIRQILEAKGQLDNLVEVVMDLGRPPEARYFERTIYLCDQPITQEDLDGCVERVGEFSGDNRAGIERTLHRISAMRNRKGAIIGLTCRVGRAIFGTINMIRDLVETGQSILLLGRPGMGKTTALREIARVLADEIGKRVVIIDTSNEIAGDGDIPHPAIGRARRMQVARPEFQHQVMIEAVENHMPEVIVIDEIGTELEALAARTIAERGVQLVGTAHGNQLANLIKNPTLSDLIGGIQSVTLGDEEMRRRGLPQKSVLERQAAPTFDIAIEMTERYRWVVHKNVAETIDDLLRGREPGWQVRSVGDEGKVKITEELPRAAEVVKNTSPRGWRSSGQIQPVPLPEQTTVATKWLPYDANRIAEARLDKVAIAPYESDYEQELVRLYLYAVSRQQAEEVINFQKLPVVITKDLEDADMVLALRSHVRSHSKLRHLLETHTIPIHTIKSSTVAHISRALRRILHIDEPEDFGKLNSLSSDHELSMFAYGDSEDEMEALEEARLAVEQIVLPKRQPVELLPRSSQIRRMQHELVEHYNLKSDSFGAEPNRRLRIYPG